MRCAKLNRYLLLGMLCMLPLTAFVQNNRAASPRKLFSLLQELNEKRKVYFFLTDASMGDWSVEPVTYSNEDPLPRILDKLLQKTTLTYKLLNAQTVVIYSRSTVPLDVAGAIGDPDNTRGDAGLMLRGRVLGIDSTPLPQATLQAGDGVGALTNTAGFFRISVKQKQTLQVSCVGYEPADILLSQVNFHEPLIVQLRLKETEMDEVIITGFDVARKMKTLGYPVSVVHTQQINNPGYTNVIAALYGKVPGVRILTAPGGATSAVQMQVRGLNSLNFNSQPVFFLDGIAIRNTNERGIKGINNGGYWDDPRIRGNGLLDINPQDIESLTILKGASATALYGSE
ncbi:MAG: TonB-dependent receptor plug domain-containing protein, partial [Chitinophagaceae bacterium]|nr:TonB-dependent receptor plug domain-containing protein [Chitinophagaceae bacterium]